MTDSKHRGVSNLSSPIQDVPDTPSIGVPVSSKTGSSISVPFTPAATGGRPNDFEAVSTPGSIVTTGISSPIVVSGVTLGTAYTFQVRARNTYGNSTYSASSNAVTPFLDYDYAVGGPQGTLMFSTDAITWDVKPQDFSFTYSDPVNNPPFMYINYLNSKYVGGTDGSSVTSTDGITWTYQKGNFLYFRDMIYQNGNYLATARTTGYLAASTDLVTWKFRTLPNYVYELWSVAYGASTYVAVGAADTIFTSTDGITWTQRSTGSFENGFYKVLYTDKFVVSGRTTGGDGRFFTSTDGITWTTRTPAATGQDIYSFAYGNGKYVATGNATSDTLQYSTDAVTWTATGPTLPMGTTMTGVAYGNNRFAAVSSATTSVYVSTDGATWTTSANVLGGTGRTVHYDGSKWLFGTNYDSVSSSNLVTSTDLVTYTKRTTGPLQYSMTVETLGYYNGVYIAAGSSGATDAPLYTSTDAVSWTTRTANFSTYGIRGLTYGNSTYVIVGTGGKISTSTDAATWTSRTSGTTLNLSDVKFFNNLFIAAGANGNLRTSTDAVTWTGRTSGFGALSITGLAYGTSTYVAVGATGRITSSTDGITWTSRTSNFGTTGINDVVFGDKFVAVGQQAKISTSTNGITWTSRTSGLSTSYFINKVSYNSTNNLYIAVCGIAFNVRGEAENRYITSTDGITWSTRNYPVSSYATQYDIISL